MDHKAAIAYINSFLRFGSKPGLERISALLDALGNPEKELQFIHVAGTNGKGSVCAYLSSIMVKNGLKTGLFTSPYVTDFCERFQIDGVNISYDELAAVTERVKTAVESLPDTLTPTEFELITAIGYCWFAEQKCDVVVLEVGLGGLYDSTNTIDTPLCSVICSISLDHTAILGDTVEKIAAQKAGIIKYDGVTVLYPDQPTGAMRVLTDTAKNMRNRLIIPDKTGVKIISETLFGTVFDYDGLHLCTHIPGKVQPQNAITAIEAARAAVPDIDDECIISGIDAARIAARCEIYDDARPLIIDGAHNPDGVKSLINLIKNHVNAPVTAVIGMMKDKDIDSVLAQFRGVFSKVYTVTVDNPRAISAKELADKVKMHLPEAEVIATDIPTAARIMREDTGAGCICGSFYLISQIRPML